MSERENRDPAWIHTSKEFLPTRLSQKPLVNELSPAGSTQKSLANELPPAGLTKKSLANELPSTGLIQRPLADDVPPLKSQSWVSKISDFFSSSTGKTTATLGAILVAVVVILMAVAEYNHRPGKKSDIKFSTPFSLWEESKRFTFASGSGTFIIPDQWEKINKDEGPIPSEPIYSIKDELISPDKQTLNNNLLNIFYVQQDEQKYPTGVIIIKYDGNKLLTYNPHTPINTNDIENILHIHKPNYNVLPIVPKPINIIVNPDTTNKMDITLYKYDKSNYYYSDDNFYLLDLEKNILYGWNTDNEQHFKMPTESWK